MEAERLKIMLVDDDPALLRLLRRWLEAAGYATECAPDGKAAKEAIEVSCPNLVITDWDMPQMDGVELCRWIRAHECPHYVYTVFLTNRCESDDMVLGLEAGADDFVKKPVDKDELLARVRSGVRVLQLESRLNALAKTDPLTGLSTRRTFFEEMEEEYARATRHARPISCVMIDIDYFKRINDTYGHQTGDQALRGLARILQENCRSSDVLGRYGGEEFCVALPETNEENAIQWAERVRKKVSECRTLLCEHDLTVTASLGVAQRLADTDNPEELVDLADQALLVAKRSGRNRVVSFQSMRESSLLDENSGASESYFQDVKAKDLMTTIVVGLNQDEPVGHAAQYFLRFRFSSAPVVDRDGKLVGVLSERDVMSIMLMPNWWNQPIKEVMKENVVCYEEETSVLIIYEFLSRVSLRNIVIVKEGKPTGMIGRGSLLRWFTNRMSIQVEQLQDGDVAQHVSPTTPREQVRLLATALANEATSLNARLSEEKSEVVPILIGGVSRLEELINDLLSHSRFAGLPTADTEEGASQPEVAQGLAAVLGMSPPDDANEMEEWLSRQRDHFDVSSAVDGE